MKRLFIILVVLSKMVYAQILFTVDMQPDTVVEGGSQCRQGIFLLR